MAEAATPDPFQLCGTTIEGKYRIASVVGDGGFGVVYRGVHKGFGELIAVKCLKLPHALDDEQRDELLEQLRDEGRLLHRLSKATSGIVQALDVGAFTTPQGVWVPYLVLEWLEGETLAEHIQNRKARGEEPYTLEDAIRLLEPAARALGVAHAHKVAHRDVKPPNLFVTEVAGARTVKILDFGIAKVLTDYPTFTEALAATKVGPSAFTPRYGAPEQFNKQRGASGPWTDVFALALILVELTTGKKALEGDDPTQLYISSADPTLRPTPRARGADVSDAVERVFEKALKVEPKNRYADAGEFWDALLDAANLPRAVRTSSAPSLRTNARSLSGDAAKTRLESVTPNAVATPSEPPSDGVSSAPRDSLGEARRSESRGGAHPSTPPRGNVDRGRDPTVPLEALTDERRKALLGVPPVEKTVAAAASPGDTGAPVKKAAADPMSETPFFARHSLPESAPAKELASGAPKPKIEPVRRSANTGSVSRPSVLPWVLVAGVVGGAGALFVAFDGWPHSSGEGPSGHASARARPSAPRPSASPPLASNSVPSATANAPASASAGPPSPPVVPQDMVLVAASKLSMGEGAEAHEVTLTKSFYIERTEVTVRDYLACMGKQRCSAADHVTMLPDPSAGDAAPQATSEFVETWTKRCNATRKALDHPINCVDFTNAESFCAFRGRRLPTEAEWELAARGAEGRAYPWGTGGIECNRACYDKNGACRRGDEQVATCASGMHLADRTPEGIVDMAGNVAEWVSDGFTKEGPSGTDPHGDPSAGSRVVRGGSFLDEEERLRATSRIGYPPSTAHVSIGFRCAMDAPVGSKP